MMAVQELIDPQHLEIDVIGRWAHAKYDLGELMQFDDRPGTWECCGLSTIVGDTPRKWTYSFTQIAWWK